MKSGVAMAIEASLRRVMRVGLCACVAVVTADALQGQATDLRAQMDKYVASNQKSIVGELVELLSIPIVAADRANIRRNADFLRAMLLRRGFTGELLETQGNPLVFGEMRTPGATRTLLLYAHYDGQPVNVSDWKQPGPWVPILRDGRMEDGGKENPARSLQEGLQLPTFNIRGLSSGFVGAGARTIVPDRAVADIDIRLVKETPADRMLDKVRAHLVKQGYHIVSEDPDDATRARHGNIVKLTSRGDGTNAYRTSPLHPMSEQVSSAIARVFLEPPVRIRTSGGTVPIAPFIELLGFPAISVPIVNFDNNQHGENENVRLGHLFRGIVTLAALLRM